MTLSTDTVVFLGGAVRPRLADRPCREIRTTSSWPFQRDVVVDPPARGTVIWIRDLHLAFPAGQTAGTRLILTQSTYQLQRWLDWLDTTPEVALVADASRASLERSSPEAFAHRGPWSRITIVDGPDAASQDGAGVDSLPGAGDAMVPHPLHDAFTQADARRRLEACHAALAEVEDEPARYLAFASACMELQLLDAAHEALDEALALAPDWEAVHFERGKLLLRLDRTDAAATAFAEAARLMPTFAAAFLNLGGALGELGRRDEAREALERALALDPRSHTALNNLGAAYREDGRLEDAAAAFRRVVALAPTFVFGYYNLGQTLLLSGDARAARNAYEEGYGRDPRKSPRQASRLAVARAAAGDAPAAIELADMLARELPAETAVDLFAEAESTLHALSTRSDVDRAGIDRLLTVIRGYSS